MHQATRTDSASLAPYLAAIGRFTLLDAEEERRLARRWRDAADRRAAHRLVTANLRFVVKIAFEYRSYGLRMADLIQEGNVGLMRAVRTFDPEREIRLVSYAVWWIRAYIQNHVLRSWSLVKVGTTQAQRKLFFSMARTRRELERHAGGTGGAPDAAVAHRLRVKLAEVEEMAQRLDGRDVSLDAPLSADGGRSHGDLVADAAPGVEERLGEAEERRALSHQVAAALERLDPRERWVVERRVMADAPLTLRQVGDHFGISRERARQLELRACDKLRLRLGAAAGPGRGEPPGCAA